MDKFYGPLAVVLVISLLMFPYIWMGQDVQVNVVDNLDSNVVWYKMLKDQNKIFAGPHEMVQGFVTETPRFSYPSGLNVELVLVQFFDIFTAYWINKLLIILIGFLSMCLFLQREKLNESGSVIGLSLLWASLDFYTHRGISIAALPMVFLVLNQLKENCNIKRGSFFLFFYAIYSMFVLAGFYLWTIFFLISIYWMVRDKMIYGYVLLGLFIWLGTYFISEYQLLYFLFGDHNFISHRSEITYLDSIWSGLYPWDFIMGTHSGAMYWWGYPFLAVGIFLIYYSRGASRDINFFGALLGIILVMCSIVSLFYLGDIVGIYFPSLHSLSLLRFRYFVPFAVFAIISLAMVRPNFPLRRFLIIGCLGINIFVYQYEWRNLLNSHLGFLPYRVPSFRQYYAQDSFDNLKTYFGEEWKKVKFGHINLPPAVSVFNGLLAVDGYLQIYSLDYKKEIRKVIKGELAKDRELAGHFDDWGNKCYLQNATYPDIFHMYKWDEYEPIKNLDFDFSYLKNELKTQFLISGNIIIHPDLSFIQKFDQKESAWNLYLYKIQGT